MGDGRKLGHVTALGPDPATALTSARQAAELLGTPTPTATSPTTDGARP